MCTTPKSSTSLPTKWTASRCVRALTGSQAGVVWRAQLCLVAHDRKGRAPVKLQVKEHRAACPQEGLRLVLIEAMKANAKHAEIDAARAAQGVKP